MTLIRKLSTGVKPQPFWRRAGWLIIIWCGSVLALFALSMLFRLLMSAAGLKLH